MPTAPPRLLLLEDDPVSARFLHDALTALPARVAHAARLADAERLAAADDAAWVFDARLPDGHAADLLPRLRARGMDTPAIALSADVDDDVRRRLRHAGFAQVLAKPLSAEALRAAVAAVCGDPGAAWDDGAALSALGSADAVRALRTLFVAELPAQRRQVRAACAAGDAGTAREVLHRLTSACGFVGAVALRDAVLALSADPADAASLARFDAAARALAG